MPGLWSPFPSTSGSSCGSSTVRNSNENKKTTSNTTRWPLAKGSKNHEPRSHEGKQKNSLCWVGGFKNKWSFFVSSCLRVGLGSVSVVKAVLEALRQGEPLLRF